MYAAQIDNFLTCILEDRRPVCDGEQGVRNMIVLEAAYTSAGERTSVALENSSAHCSRTATA